MKILAIADEEDKFLWDYFDREYFKDIDLILSAGDLKQSYLEFLVTMTSCPVLYIHGNHDSRYQTNPPGGCTCIDGKLCNFNGLRILGLGGSVRYKPGPFMYSEGGMTFRILKLLPGLIVRGGFDILLTRFKPYAMIHGHVHKAYGHFKREREHPSGARIINACGHVLIDIPDEVLAGRK